MWSAAGRIISFVLAAMAPLAGAAGQPAPAALTFEVAAADSVPLPGVEIRLRRGPALLRTGVTDSAGRWRVEGIPVRDLVAEFRRLGFVPRTIPAGELAAGANRVVLEIAPAWLDEIVTVADPAVQPPRLREFYSHMRRSSFGTFYTPTDIETRRPRRLSDLLRSAPGVRLYPAVHGSVVRIRGCRPLLWVDGVRMTGAEVDDWVNMDDVAAVEVYGSFAGLPPQYMDRQTNCGAILVWMK